MFESIMCPKCGETLEVDLEEKQDSIVCRYCLSTVEIPCNLRSQVEGSERDDFCTAGEPYGQNGLDSSFWLT
jgi:hypothetical protein